MHPNPSAAVKVWLILLNCLIAEFTGIIFLKLDINSAINNSTSTNQTRFGAKFGLVELFAEFPVSVSLVGLVASALFAG